ncbi:MAG: glycosyltransferase family 39 protein [Armatimonadota bacterium]
MLPEASATLTERLDRALARPKRSLIVCLAVTALGLALSLAALRSVPPISPDSVSYMQGAKSLVAGEGYFSVTGSPLLLFPPGYPLLIAGLIPIAGSPELAGRIVSILLSTASIPLVYLVVRHFGSRLLGVSAAGLFAILPQRVWQSAMILSDASFLFLVLLMLIFAQLWFGRDRLYMAGLAGAAAGAAYLVRPEALGMFLVVLLVALIAFRFRRRILVGALIAAILCGTLAWPYVSFIHQHTGKWQLSTKAELNWSMAQEMVLGEGFEGKLFEVGEDGSRVALEPVVNPVAVAKRAAYNEARMLVHLAKLTTPAPYCLAGLGLLSLLFYERYSTRTPGAIAVLIVLALPLIYLSIFHFEDRTLIQPTLLVLLLGAAGGLHLIDLFKNHAARVALLLGAVVAFSMLAYNVPNLTGPGMDRYAPVHEQADWIARNYPAARGMVGRNWYLAYLLEIPHHTRPVAPLEDIIAYAKHYQADFVVLPKSGGHWTVGQFVNSPEPDAHLVQVKEWGGTVLCEVRSVPIGQ